MKEAIIIRNAVESTHKYISSAIIICILLTIGLLTACQQNNEESTEERQNPDTMEPLISIDELYLNIAQYEKFYRNTQIESKEAATFHALTNTISVNALLEYLAEQDIGLDEERRELQRKLLQEQLAYDLQQPDFKRYFDMLQSALNISEQDYIERYLLVNKTHEILENQMFEDQIGLTFEENGSGYYPSGDQYQLYREKVGIPLDYLEYLAESLPTYIQKDEQLDVPFDNEYIRLTTNRNGDIILASKEFSMSTVTFEQSSFLRDVAKDAQLAELARYNFESYKTAVQEIAANDLEKRDMAQQLIAIFDIVENTMDWDFGELHNYNYKDMPTFDEQQLRKHKELTQQLIEYDYYHRAEGTPEKFYAYRVSNEQIVDMYGLFNYLQQDFGVTVDENTLKTMRIEQQKNLEQQLENPYFKAYFDKLLTTFNTSVEAYVDDYLMVLAEYEELQQLMQAEGIGLDVDGRYKQGEVHARYRQSAQMSWQQQYETIDALQKTTVIEALDPQPDSLFNILPTDIEVGVNDDGEYVFVHVNFIPAFLYDSQLQLFDQLVKNYELPAFSRYAITEYMDRLEEMPASNTKHQLIEIFNIYKNSIKE